jgi:hypothetical protein
MTEQDRAHASSEPEVVERGLRLTIHGSAESVQRCAVTYQWIDFQNEPILVDEPEELIPADDCPSFKHVALHLLRPDDDLTDLVVQCQNSNARGVVLVHSSDDLPVQGLNPSPCDDIKIPVVLIKHKVGRSLLNEMQDRFKTVTIAIVRETAIECRVPEYQTPEDRQASAATPDEKTRLRSPVSRKLKFRLTKKMRKLLYNKDSNQPEVMCQSSDMCEIFYLLDEFENKNMKMNLGKLKGKVTKICHLLKECMARNYASDFPFHCLAVLRLRSQPSYREMPPVLSYYDACVSQLHVLTTRSMETVFVPFLENKMMISWGGEKKSAVELLSSFFESVYKWHHCTKDCQSNRNIESFGVSLVAAQITLAVKQHLGVKVKPPFFWSFFIKKLNPAMLLWSQELLDQMKEKIDLGPSMGLQPLARFDCSSLVVFLEHYQLYSFQKIRQAICTLYPSLPVEPWHVIAKLTRAQIAVGDFGKRSFSAAGNLNAFVQEGRELIVTFFDMQKYTNVSSKSIDTQSSAKVDVNAPQSSEDYDAEIGEWIKLILMSPFLNIEHQNWTSYVLMLRHNTPTLLAKMINMKVTDLVHDNLERLDPVSFHTIISRLLFIREEVVD